MPKKNLLKTTVIISIISLVIVIFLSSFSQLAFNKDYYLAKQSKHGVYDVLGRNETINMTENTINFLQGKEDLNYFTENERAHMLDVKTVFNNIFSVFYPALFIFILSFIMIIYLDKTNALHNISKVFFYAGGISIILLIILFFASINFSGLFSGFHKLFFPQGNYLFPSDSLLLKLFPEAFFKSFAMTILIYSAIKAVILLAIGFMPPGISRKKKEKLIKQT